MNHFIRIILFLFLFIAPFCIPNIQADEIKVGVSKIDITPEEPMKLWGYSSRKDLSEGMFDPLYCRSVVFDDGESKAAIVSLDLGRTPPGHWVQTIRKVAKERYGIEQLLLTATHTHAAPSLGKDDQPIEWNETLSQKIYQSIEDAKKNTQPASFLYGVGEADITYDRRVVNEDETVTMLWQNHEREFTKAVDQRIKVVHITNADQQPITTLVHYACHPVVGGGKNLRISADIPGVVCSYVNEQISGECVFLQGACGDINPYLAGYLQDDPKAYEKLVEDSEIVGKEVVEIVKQAKPVKQDTFMIHHHDTIVPFGLRHPVDDERMQDYLDGYFSEEGLQKFLESNQTLEATISILTLGDTFAWVGFPGEYFDDFQVDLDNRSPIKHTFFVGFCNGYLSYFPTIEAAAEGGYGADWGLLAEPGAGERMVDEAVIGLYKVIGKF